MAEKHERAHGCARIHNKIIVIIIIRCSPNGALRRWSAFLFFRGSLPFFFPFMYVASERREDLARSSGFFLSKRAWGFDVIKMRERGERGGDVICSFYPSRALLPRPHWFLAWPSLLANNKLRASLFTCINYPRSFVRCGGDNSCILLFIYIFDYLPVIRCQTISNDFFFLFKQK